MSEENPLPLSPFHRWHLIVGFSFAMEALIHESQKDISWTDEERRWPDKLRNHQKIPGSVRVIQDRFARYTQDCRIPREWYMPLREAVFESWQDWRPTA